MAIADATGPRPTPSFYLTSSSSFSFPPSEPQAPEVHPKLTPCPRREEGANREGSVRIHRVKSTRKKVGSKSPQKGERGGSWMPVGAEDEREDDRRSSSGDGAERGERGLRGSVANGRQDHGTREQSTRSRRSRRNDTSGWQHAGRSSTLTLASSQDVRGPRRRRRCERMRGTEVRRWSRDGRNKSTVPRTRADGRRVKRW